MPKHGPGERAGLGEGRKRSSWAQSRISNASARDANYGRRVVTRSATPPEAAEGKMRRALPRCGPPRGEVREIVAALIRPAVEGLSRLSRSRRSSANDRAPG